MIIHNIQPQGQDRLLGRGIWHAIAWAAGRHRQQQIWEEWIHNKIVFVGLDDSLAVYFSGGTQTPAANWRIGMMQADPVVADTDTMAAHPGWTEFTAVTSPSRLAWGQDAVSGQQIANTTPATYTCNADGQTAGGLFLVNDATLGGATGTLYNGGAFNGGNRPLNNNETIDLYCTVIFASAT